MEQPPQRRAPDLLTFDLQEAVGDGFIQDCMWLNLVAILNVIYFIYALLTGISFTFLM